MGDKSKRFKTKDIKRGEIYFTLRKNKGCESSGLGISYIG